MKQLIIKYRQRLIDLRLNLGTLLISGTAQSSEIKNFEDRIAEMEEVVADLEETNTVLNAHLDIILSVIKRTNQE